MSPIFTLAYGYSVVTFIFALFANFLIFFLYMSGLSWSGRIFTSFTTTCVTLTFDDFLINSNWYFCVVPVSEVTVNGIVFPSWPSSNVEYVVILPTAVFSFISIVEFVFPAIINISCWSMSLSTTALYVFVSLS